MYAAHGSATVVVVLLGLEKLLGRVEFPLVVLAAVAFDGILVAFVGGRVVLPVIMV